MHCCQKGGAGGGIATGGRARRAAARRSSFLRSAWSGSGPRRPASARRGAADSRSAPCRCRSRASHRRARQPAGTPWPGPWRRARTATRTERTTKRQRTLCSRSTWQFSCARQCRAKVSFGRHHASFKPSLKA